MSTTLVIVTLIAVSVATAMTVIAIRLIATERRRSAARVEVLAADIYRSAPANGSLREGPARAVNEAELFGTATRGTRRPGMLLGGVGVVGAVCASVVLGLGTSHGGSNANPLAGATKTATPAATPLPLELVALGHERADDHLTVHGVVLNPALGMEIDHLTAVVLLFNQQGAFLTSGRAVVDPTALQPGARADFSITIAGAIDVGRYRVSFRTDDRVVPHVDRRASS